MLETDARLTGSRFGAIFKAHARPRTIFGLLTLLILLSLLTFFTYSHRTSLQWSSDDDTLTDAFAANIDANQASSMKRYLDGYLEPEWEWARNVSIVYTWVNGTDPYYLQQKANLTGHAARVDKRDRTFDELRYSLRSLMENLPWHTGPIFIVTPNQRPSWLRTDQKRVKIINQADLMPREIGTTFNSFLLEFYLDEIPGVTDYIIQHNDDYFYARYAHPSFFLKQDGRTIFYRTTLAWDVTREVSDRYLKKLPKDAGWDLKLVQALRHTGASIKEVFDDPKARFFWTEHAPYTWHRWSFAAVRIAFRDYIRDMYSHKFRHEQDLVPTIAHQAYLRQMARYGSNFFDEEAEGDRKRLVKFGQLVDDPDKNTRMFDQFRSKAFVMFNINDDMTEKGGDRPAQQFATFLEDMYPVPSDLEIV